MLKISVIILNWNGYNDSSECIGSLLRIKDVDLEIFLVDNGSTDGSLEKLKLEFPSITFVENRENYGFAKGNNIAIQKALETACSHLFLLNNDTVVDPEIMTAFLEAAKRRPKTLFGAKIYLFDQPNTFDHFGGRWNREKCWFDLVGYHQEDTGEYGEIPLDYICGAALFAPREVFEEVGLFEEKFFLVWEEADFCMRAKRKGYHLFLCPEAKVWHKVSSSFVGGRPQRTYFSWRNRLLFIERNFKGVERFLSLSRILTWETAKVLRLWQLKRISHHLGIALRQEKPERHQKIQNYRASLCGVRDYLFRRFGKGPSWLIPK